jgi:hypothetical protein
MLLNILIGFFIFLISYQIILATNPIIEGAQGYKKYEEDPMILARQNAGNIEVLKKEVDKINKVVIDGKIELRVNELEKQMEQLATENAKLGEEVSNPQPAPESV